MLKEPHSTALTDEIKAINSIQSPTPLELTWRQRLYRESRPTAAERTILLPILIRKKLPTNSTYHHGLYPIGEGCAKGAGKSRRRQVAYTLR
jgi:hypothetical protein